MLGPHSLEETIGGLAEQLAEVLTQRFGEVSVYLRGSDARMSEQDLDDADIHASLEHVRGEAVAQRVWPEAVVETAFASRFVESTPRRGIGQMRDDSATRE